MGASRRRCSICGERYADGVIFCPRDGSALSGRAADTGLDPYLGQTLQGFRVEALVGAGAVARVYRAHQLGIERKVALKIMHADLAQDDALVTRFRREARFAGALSHPNLVQVHLVSEIEHSGRPIPFLALEYLDGLSLRSCLLAQGALPIARALHIWLQMADALGEAHQHGIVHRDLKPENVMLVQRGSDRDFVKVLDFGVARGAAGSADEYASTATRAGAIFGSAHYLAPECAAGGEASPASDVYALATIAYECVCGSTPFDGDHAVRILIEQQTAEVPPLHGRPAGRALPEPLRRVIERNLAKVPTERAPDAQSFARELMGAARAAHLDSNLSSRTERGYAVSLAGEAATVTGPAATPPHLAPASSRVGSRARRALFVLLCFVAGAGAALGVAAGFGAFAEKHNGSKAAGK